MKIGILGAGHIAEKMAATINKMNSCELSAIGSRSTEKAKKFAEKFGIPYYYGSYDKLARSAEIDLIYIATPHSRHFEDCLLCLENNKNVLCEKPFTVNHKQAEILFNYAESKNLFIGEAMWTRFMPMRYVLDKIISENMIGEISSLTADLGYQIADVERIKKPELAGGALLDLGIYPLNFAVMAFGKSIGNIVSQCTKNEYGVDIHNSIIISYDNGKTAILHSNANAKTSRMGIIYGRKGRIEFKNINNCEGIEVILNDGQRINYETPQQISGYEYEVEAAIKAVSEKKTECDEMPHSETLYILRIMDQLRNEWGIRYPFE